MNASAASCPTSLRDHLPNMIASVALLGRVVPITVQQKSSGVARMTECVGTTHHIQPFRRPHAIATHQRAISARRTSASHARMPTADALALQNNGVWSRAHVIGCG
eukprot:1216112-Prymnesium_polylepis.2